VTVDYKKLSCRGTARRNVSVKILSSAAQLYEYHIQKSLQQVIDLEGHSTLSELSRFDRPYRYITSY